MPKMQPAVMRMTFNVPSDVHYLDLSQCASILNRRFYRQGINWAVAGITFVDEAGGAAGSVSVEKLHNTWVTSNAWEKGLRVWNKMNQEFALDMNPSVKPRYYDFKVHMDTSHVAGGFASNLIPRGYNVAQIGEWIASEVIVPSTGGAITAYPVKMNGASDANAKGIIEGYQDGRAVPNSPDPDVPGDLSLNWMSAVFNEGTLQTAAVLQDIEDQNDETPYDLDRYPGAGVLPTFGAGLETVDTVVFSGTTVSSRNRVGGFNAPCGLIRINHLAGNDLTMYIDLVPGEHRGYLCQKMTEM